MAKSGLGRAWSGRSWVQPGEGAPTCRHDVVRGTQARHPVARGGSTGESKGLKLAQWPFFRARNCLRWPLQCEPGCGFGCQTKLRLASARWCDVVKGPRCPLGRRAMDQRSLSQSANSAGVGLCVRTRESALFIQ